MPSPYTLAVEAGRAAARAERGDKLAAFYRAAGAAFFAPQPELPTMPKPFLETTDAALARAERALAALRTLKNETKAVFPGEFIPDHGSLMDDVPDLLDTAETKLRAVIARLNAMPAEAA